MHEVILRSLPRPNEQSGARHSSAAGPHHRGRVHADPCDRGVLFIVVVGGTLLLRIIMHAPKAHALPVNSERCQVDVELPHAHAAVARPHGNPHAHARRARSRPIDRRCRFGMHREAVWGEQAHCLKLG
eukprot:scaffold91157_cov54-Phaeocystis_antarctica.AAC.1